MVVIFQWLLVRLKKKTVKETIDKLEEAIDQYWMKEGKKDEVVLLEDVRKVGKKRGCCQCI